MSSKSQKESENVASDGTQIEKGYKLLKELRNPGASKLSKMGVAYKPTIRYKMSSPEPNIL